MSLVFPGTPRSLQQMLQPQEAGRWGVGRLRQPAEAAGYMLDHMRPKDQWGNSREKAGNTCLTPPFSRRGRFLFYLHLHQVKRGRKVTPHISLKHRCGALN